MPDSFTRRQLALGTLGLVSAAELASAFQHAHQAANSSTTGKFEYLDSDTAQEIEAIASEIIPSSDGPGAREAGVVYFIDRALATWEADKRETYRKGMEELQRTRKRLFPNSARVGALGSGELVQLIGVIEKTDFFELLRRHTVMGFLGSPAYGGNRGRVGWAHIGFEDRMIFEPPFGYYDAEPRKEDGP